MSSAYTVAWALPCCSSGITGHYHCYVCLFIYKIKIRLIWETISPDRPRLKSRAKGQNWNVEWEQRCDEKRNEV